MTKIKLSVAMTTYNHEKYIAQAIEGVLLQKINFSIELVIGDDCSKDRTLEICLKYQLRYPKMIKILKSERNQGLRKNNFNVWTNCIGEYIAYCEGDDFWTNSKKLQRQVDFLDSNAKFSGTFHQTALYCNEERPTKLFTPINQKLTLNFEENIERWVVGTCSLVFRNIFKTEGTSNYGNLLLSDEVFYADRPLMAFLTKSGDFFYFPEVMGCWRQHESNMTKIGNLAEMSKAGGEAYEKMIVFFPENRIKLSEQAIRWYMLAYFYSIKKKKINNALIYNWKSFKNIKSLLGFKNYVKCTIFVLMGKEIYK